MYKEINGQCDSNQLQNDLDHLSSWAQRWQLNFNVSKCYHLGICNTKAPPLFNYYLNGHAITSVHSTKYLGVTVTANLSWNSHCDIMCTSANGTLGLLRRILSGCSAEVKARAYKRGSPIDFSGSGIWLILRPGFGILGEKGSEIRDCRYERDTRFEDFTKRDSGNIAFKKRDPGSPVTKCTKKIKLSSS